MVNCTCNDYQHGHLCKHAHKVYCREKQEQNGTDEDDSLEIRDADTPNAIPDGEDQVTILKTHVAPSKAIQDEAGIVMNRTSCHAYSKMDFYILLLGKEILSRDTSRKLRKQWKKLKMGVSLTMCYQ